MGDKPVLGLTTLNAPDLLWRMKHQTLVQTFPGNKGWPPRQEEVLSGEQGSLVALATPWNASLEGGGNFQDHSQTLSMTRLVA